MARYINADKLIENCEFFETEMEVKNAPTEDVVERNSVLEMLSKINNAVEDGDGFQYEEWVEYVKDVPSAEKTARWISISERLPEEFQRVLVTIVNYKGDKVVRVAEYYNRKGKGVFQIKENHEQWEVGEKGLLAWMPLPKPYKAE